MTDNHLRGLVLAGHESRCGNQVSDVGSEIGVGKIAFALPQAGKVETEYRNPLAVQGRSDVYGGFDILGAGEAVGEQGVSDRHLIPGQVEPGCKIFTATVGKSDPL